MAKVWENGKWAFTASQWDYLKEVEERRRRSQEAQKLEPGVYELPSGEIYLVKFNRQRTHVYAKRLVESTARLTEEGGRVKFDFLYEAGALYRIRPEYKMSLERAKPLMIKYGRCIVCGRNLKVAESVERGIGPVCIKAFAVKSESRVA